MKLLHKNGVLSLILRVKILSAATNEGLTGLTNASSGLIISTIASNEAAAVSYTVAAGNIETIATLGTYAQPSINKCRFKEVDAVNHPGLYEIQLPDPRLSYLTTATLSLIVSLSGAADMKECDLELQLVAVELHDSVRMGLTALPDALADAPGGLPISDAGGLDLDAINNIKDKTDLLPASPAAVGSAMTLEAGAIAAATFASGAITADAIAADAIDAIGAADLASDVAAIQTTVESTRKDIRSNRRIDTTNPDQWQEVWEDADAGSGSDSGDLAELLRRDLFDISGAAMGAGTLTQLGDNSVIYVGAATQ